MEPTGLAVGIAGLAGLFNSITDTITRFRTYKSFQVDSEVLQTQFETDILRFERWGDKVGLNNGQLSTNHSAKFDKRVYCIIERLLRAAEKLSDPEQLSHRNGRGVKTGLSDEKPHDIDGERIDRDRFPESRRSRFKWAFVGGKLERKDQVEGFGKIVDSLYNLAPYGVVEDRPLANKVDVRLSDVLQGTQKVLDTFDEILQKLDPFDRHRKAMLRKDIDAWLVERQSPNERYNESTQKRLKGTCNWILSRPEFLKWLSSEFPMSTYKFMWINGHAGFGKTILCSRVVEYLTTQFDTPIAYFFFSSEYLSREDPYNAVRSWIQQLASKNNRVLDIVTEKWVNSEGQTIAARATIIQLLRSILQYVPECTLIVDGLDECIMLHDSRGLVTNFLSDIRCSSAGTSTRILIVSRDEPEIHQAIAGATNEDCHTLIEMKIGLNNTKYDIEAVSSEIINRKLFTKSQSDRDSLSASLAHRCDGQFLWLAMQEPSLRGTMDKRRLQKTIEETPSALKSIYDRSWERIDKQPNCDRDRAFALLRWAAYSLRPLTVSEITEAVLIDESSQGFPADDLPDDIDDDYVNNEILGLCSPLLEVRRLQSSEVDLPIDKQTVHIAHFTVTQYLVSHLPVRELQTNGSLCAANEKIQSTTLAQSCLRYIRAQNVWLDKSLDPHTRFHRSFLSYAAKSWPLHLCPEVPIEQDQVTLELVDSFMDNRNPSWSSWRAWFIRHSDDRLKERLVWSRSTPPGPLYYLALFGLTTVVTRYIQRIGCSAFQSLEGKLALNFACLKGNLAVVQTILDAGIDINPQPPGTTTTPLHEAAISGHLKVVELLLERGADVSIPTAKGSSGLHPAAFLYRVDIVRSLLDKGADVNLRNKLGYTPILEALEFGDIETVKLLLDKGADLSIPDRQGCTPLMKASKNDSLEIARLFIEKGANVNFLDETGSTALTFAAFNGHLDIAKTLVNHGADVNLAGSEGWTPLYVASSSGHAEVIKFLLENGADHKPADSRGWTPLISASSSGHVEVVKILLENGADINLTTNDGVTPLACAAYEGHIGVVEVLLKTGADINLISLVDDEEKTPLVSAAYGGCAEAVRVLLETGANVNPTLSNGITPLTAAAESGHLEVVQLLLENGANVDLLYSGNAGWTPLATAADEGHTEVVQLLLENGASVDLPCCGNDGWTPLTCAADDGRLEVVKLLLEKGADIGLPTTDGVTPLTYATCRGHTEVVRVLLGELGVNIVDNSGWTPLHHASRFGHYEMSKVLLTEYGMRADVYDTYGNDPLSIAVRHGHCQVVELILASGHVSIDFSDTSEQSLIWWARRGGRDDMLDILQEHARKSGAPLRIREHNVEVKPVQPNSGSSWCDRCTLSINDNSVRYRCDTCNHGDFDLCTECVDWGYHCLDSSHPLRRVEARSEESSELGDSRDNKD